MIPARHINRYLNGGCMAFAVALKREFNLPIYALVDRHGAREDWPHVFVASEEYNFAVDVRGIRPLEANAIAEGANVGDEIKIMRVSVKDAQWKLDRYPTATEVNEARALVRQYLTYEVDQALLREHEASGSSLRP